MNDTSKYSDIKDLSYSLKVLYVEDEEDTREVVSGVLKLFFKDVVVAVDGNDAKEKLIKENPDLLITDIQMPKIDGLELIKYTKDNYKDIPIIITTAFTDQEYILQSFDLGVTQYIIKPIKEENLIDVIYKTSKMLDNSKKAQELEIYKTKQVIDYASEHIIDQILGSIKSPCIIYTDNKIRYSNKALDKLMDNKDINSIFDKSEGFMARLEDYTEDDPAKNVVSISKNNGRKVFRIIRSNINIDEVLKKSNFYLFVDITLEEYQKIKIKSYTEVLESIIIKTKYKKSTEEKNKPSPITDTKVDIKDAKKLTINDEENEILRRSHKNKTTAKEYIKELDDETLKELQELDDLDKDFSYSISLLREDANIEGMKEMAKQLEHYAHEISLLFEFSDLSYAIHSLSALFNSVDESKLTDKNIRKLILILDGIKDDLANWRKVIFIEQDSLDIHYLDSSLFSACLQIELVLSDDVKEMESEEDDLILF